MAAMGRQQRAVGGRRGGGRGGWRRAGGRALLLGLRVGCSSSLMTGGAGKQGSRHPLAQTGREPCACWSALDWRGEGGQGGERRCDVSSGETGPAWSIEPRTSAAAWHPQYRTPDLRRPPRRRLTPPNRTRGLPPRHRSRPQMEPRGLPPSTDLDNLLKRLLVDLHARHALLHVPQDHVEVLVVRLHSGGGGGEKRAAEETGGGRWAAAAGAASGNTGLLCACARSLPHHSRAACPAAPARP